MLDNAVHKNILIQILKDIYTDMSVGPVLGFKGGTAAYMFYHLDRVSLDLDFDLLDQAKAGHVHNILRKIVSSYGTAKEDRKKRNTIFLMLSYAEKAPNIKVDEDHGSRGHVRP